MERPKSVLNHASISVFLGLLDGEMKRDITLSHYTYFFQAAVLLHFRGRSQTNQNLYRRIMLSLTKDPVLV